MARPTGPKETRTMRRSRYSDEQIAYTLRQAETGATELRELRLLRELVEWAQHACACARSAHGTAVGGPTAQWVN
jgi:hypothetical protein